MISKELQKLWLWICYRTYELTTSYVAYKILFFTFHLERYTKLPFSLFMCLQLRCLNLHNCSIHHPWAFQGFDKLISLELCRVTISSKLLEILIFHCPLHEQLMLDIPKFWTLLKLIPHAAIVWFHWQYMFFALRMSLFW